MNRKPPRLGELGLRRADEGPLLFGGSVQVEADGLVRTTAEEGSNLRVAELGVPRQPGDLVLWLSPRIEEPEVLGLAIATQLVGYELIARPETQDLGARFERGDGSRGKGPGEQRPRASVGKAEHAAPPVEQDPGEADRERAEEHRLDAKPEEGGPDRQSLVVDRPRKVAGEVIVCVCLRALDQRPGGDRRRREKQKKVERTRRRPTFAGKPAQHTRRGSDQGRGDGEQGIEANLRQWIASGR